MYKESKIIFPVLIVIMAIIAFLAYKSGQKEIKRDEKLIRNGIVFSGIVEDYKISNNHCFGILKLKITESNRPFFECKSKKIFYPYKIKDTIAEIYIHICDIQNGFKVKLNSNNKTVTVLKGNDILQELEIAMVHEDTDINFARKNTIFKD
jgi:hypothetical protein